MNLDGLLDALKTDEGRKVDKRGRHVPYKCPADKLTIGYGRNIQDNGISEREALDLLTSDAIQAQRDAASLIPNWLGLDDVRQNAIANLAFNMGGARLATFVKFIQAVNDKRFTDAAKEIRNSKYYGQVGSRAVRIANEIETGKVE